MTIQKFKFKKNYFLLQKILSNLYCTVTEKQNKEKSFLQYIRKERKINGGTMRKIHFIQTNSHF